MSLPSGVLLCSLVCVMPCSIQMPSYLTRVPVSPWVWNPSIISHQVGTQYLSSANSQILKQSYLRASPATPPRTAASWRLSSSYPVTEDVCGTDHTPWQLTKMKYLYLTWEALWVIFQEFSVLIVFLRLQFSPAFQGHTLTHAQGPSNEQERHFGVKLCQV